MLDLIDRFGRTAASRRLLERELLLHQDGIGVLEQKLERLTQLDPRSSQTADVPKELKAEAIRLGLRHHTLEKLRQHVAGLRLVLHQMIVTPGLEIHDLNAWKDCSIDGHVLELITESGMVEKLLGSHPRHLERLSAFRRESCNEEGVIARHGKIGNFARLSTLWLAAPSEAQALFRNPRLRQHRFIEPFIFAKLEAARESEASQVDLETAPATFVPLWRAFISRLISARLHDALLHLKLDQSAMERLADWTSECGHDEDGFIGRVALPFVVTIAAVNSCSKIEQFSPETTGTISAPDIDTALLLARPAITRTVTLRRESTTLAPIAPIAPSLESVLAKLSSKGPLSKRELVRSFHKMKSDDLEVLLQDGIASGAITIAAGKYVLGEPRIQ